MFTVVSFDTGEARLYGRRPCQRRILRWVPCTALYSTSPSVCRRLHFHTITCGYPLFVRDLDEQQTITACSNPFRFHGCSWVSLFRESPFSLAQVLSLHALLLL